MTWVNSVTTTVDLEALPRDSWSSPVNLLGPFCASALVDCLSLGILCCQVWTYHSNFPKDPIWIKRVVGLTVCLSIFSTVRTCYIVWENSILHFGDWERALKLGWVFYTSPFVATTLQTTAQTFFVWRCYALTGWNRCFLVFLLVALLAGLTLSAGLSAQLISNPNDIRAIGVWALPMFVVFIVFDSTVTATVSYILISPRNFGDSRNTKSVIEKLLVVTWQSALPPTITQFAGIGVQFGKDPGLLRWNFLMGELISRLYVFSLMHNLNSRLEIRQFSLAVQRTDFPGNQSGIELSTIRFRKDEGDTSRFSVPHPRDQGSPPDRGVREPLRVGTLYKVPSRGPTTISPDAVGSMGGRELHIPVGALPLNGRFQLVSRNDPKSGRSPHFMGQFSM